MLIGSYNHTTDPKGRLFIPAKWREELGSPFIVTRGIDGCLMAMSKGEFEKLAEKLASVPFTDVKAQKAHRAIARWTQEVEMDKQGRALIGSQLRQLAEIETNVTLIGMSTRVEIWSSEALAVRDEQELAYEELLEYAKEYGV